MSKADPIFGIDAHPRYQRGLDFGLVKERGYEFAFVKASQGSSYVPDGFRDYFRRVKAAGLIPGVYHFLDESASAKAQAQHFLKTIGGVDGKLIAVDFESYGDLSPYNSTLKAFIAELRREIGSHPVILYSGAGFWNGGDPSGSFKQYGADAAWDAFYTDMNKHDHPKDYYDSIRGWGWGERWGGVEPMFWQFTSAGLVAGQYVDVDAYRGTREQLLALTKVGAVPSQPPKPAPREDTLPDYVEKTLAYLERCAGGLYTPWKSGNFAGKEGPPAWAANKAAPDASRVRDEGSFCAGVLNLASRVRGHLIFQSTQVSWAGGVKWWQERLAKKDVLKRFDPSEASSYPPGTLLLRRFTGPDLADQGHVAVKGRNGKVIQSDGFDGPGPNGTLRPGVNDKRTVLETHKLLIRFDGGGWEYYVLPEDWLK